MQSDRAYTFLLALLRLALGENVQNMPMALSPDEWREVYRMAAKHAVIAIAWDGVEQLQQYTPQMLQSMPADLMGKWFADVHAIETANSRMAKHTAQVQKLLNDGGFGSQVLKGATLAAYYPKPEHRQAADIDLWVLPQQGKSLAAHRQALLTYLQSQPAVVVGQVVYHHIETTIGDVEVEVHVTPTWLCHPLHNRRLQQLFAQNRQLTPEQQELYALLHAFRHIYHDGLALRHVLDFYLVCASNRQRGISAPYQLYAQLGLQLFAQAICQVADYVMGKTPANRLSARAMHILQALPERRVSCRVQWNYPGETLCNLPWRAIHYIWRKSHQYA